MTDDPVCEYCEERPADPKLLRKPDPLIAELHPNDLVTADFKNWCRKCYTDRLWDS